MRSEFSRSVRDEARFRSGGYCEVCADELKPGWYQYDHILPAWLGGQPTVWNCHVLCRRCHSEKTSRRDIPRIAKTKRQKAKHEGTWRASRNPMPGSRRSKWRKPLRGPAELRQ